MTSSQLIPLRASGLLAILSILLCSCVAANTDVESEDRLALFSDARVTWAFAKETVAESASELPGKGDPKAPESRASLDLHVSHARSSADQQLLPGEVVVFGGQIFDDSQTLLIDFEMVRVLLDARLHSRRRHGFAFDAFAGLEFTSLDLGLREAVPNPRSPAHSRVNMLGPAVGGALDWQPLETLKIYAEARAGYGVTSGSGASESTTLDLGFVLFSNQPMLLSFGWRKVRIDSDPEDFFQSGLDLRLSGPVIGIWIQF